MKTWDDQPDEILGAEKVAGGSLAGGIVFEVRKGPVYWWFSAGNLFGSETVQCDSAETAWRVLESINHRGKNGAELPRGARLLMCEASGPGALVSPQHQYGAHDGEED